VAQFGNLGYIPDLNDIVEVKVYCKTTTQLSVNVRHFVCIDKQGTGAPASSILTYYKELLAPLYKALMSVGAEYRGLSLQKISPAPIAALAFDDGEQGVGDVGGDPLPGQVCGILTFRSNLAGRANRGRMFVPFPSETDNDADQTPIDGYIVRLSELGDAFIGADEIGGGGNTVQLQSIVLHRVSMSGTALITWKANNKWATQRRRGSYGRPNESPL